jgi:hypothetical protein
MTSCTSVLITKGQSSIWIQKIYKCFGKTPFTCKDITEKIPDFSGGSMLTQMREANVIRLKNRKKRAIGMRKDTPSIWVFTTEALFILQRNVK